MAETRTQYRLRRSRELNRQTKGALCALYRSMGGLGGVHPPERWRKDELIASVVDIEWDRLPEESKAEEHGPFDPPCSVCGKGYQPHPEDHHYTHTAGQAPEAEWLCRSCGRTQQEHTTSAAPETEDQDQEFPPPCGRCGKPPADHLGWEQGHLFIRRMSYQEPTEVQPHGAGATAGQQLHPAAADMAAAVDRLTAASAALAETIANPPEETP